MSRLVDVKIPSQPRVLPVRAAYCASYLCRLKGLMFHRQITRDEGLLLVNPRDSRLDASIHMLFVWFDLGIVWINNDMYVVDTRLAKAWHPAYFPKAPARYVLEIHPERLIDFQTGQKVIFENA